MTDIEISRAEMKDRRLINDFFKLVIIDTFHKNGITYRKNILEAEIMEKEHRLDQYFESDEKYRCFLIAKDNNTIVGSIECGPPNDLILSNTNGECQGLLEIGTVFVHPDYQNKGIGSRMLHAMLLVLDNIGISEFCLDSGYKTAQKIWTYKFGNPQYLLKNYWDEDHDHMIWKVRVVNV